MSTWNVVMIASILVVLLKMAGYLVPQSLLEKPAPSRVSGLLTVALLSALIAVQTLGAGQAIEVDARVPAILVAAGLFALRVPFILVIIAAAVVAAVVRAIF